MPEISAFSMRRAARSVGLLALLATAGCHDYAPTTPAPTAAPYIQGRITQVGHAWGVLVEGTPGPGHQEDKAYVDVRGASILRRDGAPVDASALVVGRRVSVWITGIVRESYPVQVDATVVVLEPEPTSSP
jgi:hypothetical protein